MCEVRGEVMRGEIFSSFVSDSWCDIDGEAGERDERDPKSCWWGAGAGPDPFNPFHPSPPSTSTIR